MSEQTTAQTQKAEAPKVGDKGQVRLQRQCACGQHTVAGSECALCRKKSLKLQRWSANRAAPDTVLRSLGQSLNLTPNTFEETRFGHDFSRVRAHTNALAAGRRPPTNEARHRSPWLRTRTRIQRAAKDKKAALEQSTTPPVAEAVPSPATTEVTAPAFEAPEPTTEPTSPSPETAPTPARSEPTTEPAPPTETAAPALLVEDAAAEVASGQMKKSEFMAQLRSAVCATADATLAGTEQSTDGCPYLDFWFGYYEQKDSRHIERAIHKYAPETAGITTASEYIPLIAARVRQSVETWARTGEITGVPEGVPTPGTAPAESGESAKAPAGSLFFKARPGGARAAENPEAVQAKLGAGRSLDSGVRSRMESAFGRSFAHVRAHTDARAAGLSSDLNARAFTVGEHVAFGAGEYRPGTLVGDALIAHELAHVAQQRGAQASVAPMEMGSANYNLLEEDADRSAVGAVAALWGGAEGALADIADNAIPRLRSGLQLSRCGTTRAATQTGIPPTASAPAGTSGTPCPTSVRVGAISQRNHSNLPASQKERWGTYLGAMSSMEVGPGPDHTGHCMKERLTTTSNNCPAAVYTRNGRTTEPCTGNKCLDINRYGTLWGVSDGPTAFLDMHRTRNPSSLLEGTGVNSCMVVCEQIYTCDRTHPTTGVFRITRSFQADSYTRPDGTQMQITTGTVTKTER